LTEPKTLSSVLGFELGVLLKGAEIYKGGYRQFSEVALLGFALRSKSFWVEVPF